MLRGGDILSKVVMRGMILKGHLDVHAMRRNTKDARKRNERLLFKILRRSQGSEYGRKYGFADIHSVEEYRQKVPITTFSDYEDYVDRMVNNDEQNLICSLPAVGYAMTSGSVGTRKYILLTKPEVNIYTKYTVTRVLALADEYHRKHAGKGIPLGRGMLTLPGFGYKVPSGLPLSNVADVAARYYGFIFPYILTYPLKERFTGMQADFKYTHMRFALEDRNTVYMFSVFFHEYTEYIRYLRKHWQTLVDDIEKGVIGDLAHAVPEVVARFAAACRPNPERAAELRREFEKGFDETIVKRLWPHMSVICGIGTATFTPFARMMRHYTEGIPYDFSIYGASEGLFAAADELESHRQLLLVDSCYFEFSPVEDPDTILSLDELEVGEEYEIIITNQAGLYRYKCGDVVQVLGYRNSCPYLVFSYRKGQLLSISGEKTTEEHMAAVVKAIEEETGCTIDAWAAYIEVDDESSHYLLLAENNQGIDLAPYGDFATERLKEINYRFTSFLGYTYSGMRIANQIPGTHQEWTDRKIAENGGRFADFQVKPVRIIDTPEKEAFFLPRVVK